MFDVCHSLAWAVLHCLSEKAGSRTISQDWYWWPRTLKDSWNRLFLLSCLLMGEWYCYCRTGPRRNSDDYSYCFANDYQKNIFWVRFHTAIGVYGYQYQAAQPTHHATPSRQCNTSNGNTLCSLTTSEVSRQPLSITALVTSMWLSSKCQSRWVYTVIRMTNLSILWVECLFPHNAQNDLAYV